jgi:hypothetical protein
MAAAQSKGDTFREALEGVLASVAFAAVEAYDGSRASSWKDKSSARQSESFSNNLLNKSGRHAALNPTSCRTLHSIAMDGWAVNGDDIETPSTWTHR